MFKIGDKVIYTSGRWGSNEYNPYYKDYPNIIGIIVSLESDILDVTVNWSNGIHHCSYYKDDLKLIDKLTQFYKKLGTQK